MVCSAVEEIPRDVFFESEIYPSASNRECGRHGEELFISLLPSLYYSVVEGDLSFFQASLKLEGGKLVNAAGAEVAEVRWENAAEESGEPYDVSITPIGGTTVFVEVKASVANNGFTLSHNQWMLAQKCFKTRNYVVVYIPFLRSFRRNATAEDRFEAFKSITVIRNIVDLSGLWRPKLMFSCPSEVLGKCWN